jgi:putative DNA primase/helicase
VVVKPIDFDRLPVNLPDGRFYVGWNFETSRGRLRKVPCTVTYPFRWASVTDPSTWSTLAAVRRAYEKHVIGGIGLVLSDQLPRAMTMIDLDHCVTETGTLSPPAGTLIKRFRSYAEYSPTDGAHVAVFGRLPVSGRQRPGLGLYHQKRFMTLTGDALPDHPDYIADCQAALDAWFPRLFPPGPVPTCRTPLDTPVTDNDLTLIARAHHAGNGDRFAALWQGDDSAYPSQSEADLALCVNLAFWTQKDEVRMDRLFRKSGLMRPKWDELRGDHETYGTLTIRRAIATVLHVYVPRHVYGNDP